jgi:zinc protease
MWVQDAARRRFTRAWDARPGSNRYGRDVAASKGDVTPDVHVTEVDGVPAVWTDVPGPFTAGLLVRMGYADEVLPRRGHSHMLEHLALFGLGRPGEHANGHVDATTTLLHATGEPEDVASFLSRAARQLVDPPVGRLEEEKGVLRTEHARRGTHPFNELQVWRWGMRTYGLEATEEHGLATMTPDSVREWSRQFVGTANATLWFTGPPPAGLSLELPDGERIAAPDPRRCVLPQLPAYYRSSARIVGAHGLVARDWAGPALAAIVRNRLVDELRTARAVAYSPQAGYQALDGEVAALLAMSDVVERREPEVTDRLMTILGELSGPTKGPRPEELGAHRDAVLRGLETNRGPRIATSAWDLLHGKAVVSEQELREGLDRLSPEMVSRAAREAASTLLVQVPGDTPVPSGWDRAPESTAAPVTGREHQQRRGPATLTVGDEGVTLAAGRPPLTVRFDDLEAVGAWDDGGRVLIAGDGVRLAVEPTLWWGGARAVEAVDAATPHDRVVGLGSRSPDQIPRPPSLWTRVPRSPELRNAVVLLAALMLLLALSRADAINGFVLCAGLIIGLVVFFWVSRERNP